MDYLRQLRNDEKRCTFALVGTIYEGNVVDGEALYDVLTIPKNACNIRSYLVVKKAFAAGSLLDLANVITGDTAGEAWFAAVDLAVEGVTLGSASLTASLYRDGKNVVQATINEVAQTSAIGEAQIVLEYTEQPVRTGLYTT